MSDRGAGVPGPPCFPQQPPCISPVHENLMSRAPTTHSPKDESPRGNRPIIFRPYILHSAYWYESGCFRRHSLTLPNRWLTAGEYLRSLPVAPLIGDKRYYGGTPAGLPTYPPDWLVRGGQRCGANGWAFGRRKQTRRFPLGSSMRHSPASQAQTSRMNRKMTPRKPPFINASSRISFEQRKPCRPLRASRLDPKSHQLTADLIAIGLEIK